MLPRFHVPDLDPGVTAAALPPDEARHLTRVLRLREGDEITVFDGRGHEFRARVSAAARDRVQVELLEPTTPAPEPRVPITIAQAVLKGAGMDDVVRDATMMGACAIDPIVTARTIGRPRTAGSTAATERWRRIAISSAKQCRRATVPVVSVERSLSEWLSVASGLRLILVEPSAAGGAEPTLRMLDAQLPQTPSLVAPGPAAVSILVGPEGGWTPEERRMAEAAGCVAVSLGALTLRADAVALVAIAMARFALRDL